MTDTDPRDSNPNAAGPHGLQGDMGVSSERTGPFGGSEAESADTGVQGTGSHGSAAEQTEGTMSTDRSHPQEPAEGRRDVGAPGASTPHETGTSEQAPDSGSSGDSAYDTGDVEGANGPEMDDTQQQATQEWRETQPAADDTDGEINRTVGEANTAEVPSHDFDRSKNPGHSHG